MHDLPGSALDLSAMIDAGTVSAEEVMTATLDRIEEVNPQVNALVSLRPQEALLDAARAADKGPRKGWLHGIPIAIKDLVNAEGLPTSSGSPLFAGQMAAADDVYVSRIRAAGAIVIGKTNVPEFGLGSHTFNPVFGATRNPYNPDRTCGGSSGGAAVALATGLLTIADGSDMMGSLRNPAGWCNVYGMRPSAGLVPAEPGEELYLQHLATDGPMARCPADLAALLDTMAGPDPRRPFGLNLPMALPDLKADVAGRRIGWLGDWGGAFALEPGILDLCEAALSQMQDLGLVIDPMAPPHPAEAIWESWTGLRHFAVASKLRPLFENSQTRDRLKSTAQWEIENGLTLSGTEIQRLSVLRSTWFRRALELFDAVDMLALPTAQVWPFQLDQEYPTEIAGHGMDTYHRWMEVMIAASLIGLPAISVPIGFGATGLPMGLQLIGPRGSDARLLQVAEAWHQATNWPDTRPPKLN